MAFKSRMRLHTCTYATETRRLVPTSLILHVLRTIWMPDWRALSDLEKKICQFDHEWNDVHVLHDHQTAYKRGLAWSHRNIGIATKYLKLCCLTVGSYIMHTHMEMFTYTCTCTTGLQYSILLEIPLNQDVLCKLRCTQTQANTFEDKKWPQDHNELAC